MIGILVEKPSAGANFAKALGGQSGSYNGEAYKIVAARGHLYEFADPADQVSKALSAQYKAWNIANLPWNEKDFIWKRTKKKDTASTLQTIKTTLDACDEIVIATDVDPTGEGNLIAWEIFDELGLTAKRKKFSRMFFVDEAAASIQKAFVSRQPIATMLADMDFVKADFRSKFDYLTMQFTRIATACGDGKSVLRQGRLKSSMVLLVGDGLKAHNNYKKVPFYENRFRDENGNVFTSVDEPKFPDKASVPTGYIDSPVIVDSKMMKSQSPPKLPDLAKMSAALSNKGVKAKDVLAVYQKMYEAQVVSYPRTEDKTITPEQFQELSKNIQAIATVVGVDASLLTHIAPRSTHIKTGGAHGANRPGPNVPKSLDDLKQYGACAIDIYVYLAKFALMMFCEDYEYEQQKGHLEKYPKFLGQANVPKKMGYKQILSSVAADDEDDETSMGLGKIASPFIHEGFPQRPPHPSMKWLMTQLEKYDVGTGATRTSIYADVTNEKSKFPLMIEKKGKLTLSNYGDMSYRLLPGTHIGDIKMTERLMGQMRDIAKGMLSPDACLAEVKQMVRDDVITMQNNGQTMRKELGITMAKNEQAEKFTGIWTKTGKEVSFKKSWGTHDFTDDECKRLLNGETIEINGLISEKTGKSYGVVGELAEQTYNGKKFIGFLRTGFANSGSGGAQIPDEWCQHKFTDDEKTLLEAGKSVELSGCVSKKGSVFSCKVSWGKNDKGYMAIIPEFNK